MARGKRTRLVMAYPGCLPWPPDVYEARTKGQCDKDKTGDGLPWLSTLATRGVGGQQAGP